MRRPSRSMVSSRPITQVSQPPSKRGSPASSRWRPEGADFMLETLNLEAILPELILSCGAMALLMIGVATKRERGELVLWLAILIIGAAGVFVVRGEGTATLFSGSFIVDPYARMLKLL